MVGRSEGQDREFAAVAVFATTHWSTVLSAGDQNSPHRVEALERLCLTYWFPIYAYVRRHGQSPPDAQDLTQEFFCWTGAIWPACNRSVADSARSCLLRSGTSWLTNGTSSTPKSAAVTG
jgi:hypothetical protein